MADITPSIAHVSLEFIPPEDRDFPADCIRVSVQGGQDFLCTEGDLDHFDRDIHLFRRYVDRSLANEKRKD